MINRMISLGMAACLAVACDSCKEETVPVNRSDTPASTAPEIIAHRGVSSVAPENTAAAIRLAWQVGCPAAECDVRLTRDNRVMLMHDESAKRTGGADLLVAATDSARLRQLDVGAWKGPAYAGEKVPFLDEILEVLPAHRTLFIEIKCGPEILEPLKALIDQSGKAAQLVLISFNLDALTAAKQRLPHIPTCWLIKTKKSRLTGRPLKHKTDLIETARAANLDGLSVHCAGLAARFARQTLDSGLKLYTWTVDDPQEARRLQKLGVHGITTNCPDRLMEDLQVQKMDTEAL